MCHCDQSGELLQTLTSHTDAVLTVAYSQEHGLIASGSDDQTIGVWDVKTGQRTQTIPAHNGSVRSIVFGPNKTLFSGGSDERLRQWSWQTGECLQDLRIDRPYERMNISNLAGLMPVQLDTLRLLGAIEE